MRVAFISYRDRNHGEGFDGPVSESELYVKDLDGSGLRRLTRTIAQQEAGPSWDPSGNVIAYTQATTPGGELFGLGASNVVMEVNADGSCARRIFGKPSRSKFSRHFVGLYGPVWQPGSGRDAARVACG